MTAIITITDDEIIIAPLAWDEDLPPEDLPPEDDHEGEHFCACAGAWTALTCSCRPDFKG
jgi:hypothetical protein